MAAWGIVRDVIATGFAVAAVVCIFVAMPMVIPCGVVSLAFSNLRV